MPVLERILPRVIDNTRSPCRIAMGLLGVVALLRAAQSISILVGGESIVRGADGVPLETFSRPAADSVIAIFAVSAVSRLVLSALSFLVLVRYRAAVGLMLLVTVVDMLGRELALGLYHLERVGAPVGPTVNRVLLAGAAVGLVLSLARR